MNTTIALDAPYRMNDTKAVSETLDGEAIIINLETGNYYSTNETGSVIWELLAAGATLRMTAEVLSQRYIAPLPAIEKSAADFMATLLADGLVVEAAADATVPHSFSGDKKPFEEPALKKYDDMQEMLLADPIHDVGEGGWPILKNDRIPA